MQKELDTAKRLAARAWAILLDHYNRPRIHGHSNPVADARHSVNTFLVEELKRSFPGDGIVSMDDHDHHHAFSGHVSGSSIRWTGPWNLHAAKTNLP